MSTAKLLSSARAQPQKAALPSFSFVLSPDAEKASSAARQSRSCGWLKDQRRPRFQTCTCTDSTSRWCCPCPDHNARVGVGMDFSMSRSRKRHKSMWSRARLLATSTMNPRTASAQSFETETRSCGSACARCVNMSRRRTGQPMETMKPSWALSVSSVDATWKSPTMPTRKARSEMSARRRAWKRPMCAQKANSCTGTGSQICANAPTSSPPPEPSRAPKAKEVSRIAKRKVS
mmetsp:Transcript_51257/g.148007  ORF Transcript_51257/g.148007 Transcript_51257/m.148007 type:complete len:233 (+) Transcript_51257:174-872(+)